MSQDLNGSPVSKRQTHKFS